MAYEVTKTINGRPYRYRVDRVRDEASGRMRSRWTYLGREPGAVPARPPKPRRSDVPERILDAIERLLATIEYDDLTADAIAREAGIAHGTFYRHYRDKAHALDAAIERLRANRAPIVGLLRDDVPTLAGARANMRAFVEALFRTKIERPALLRAFYSLSERDPHYAAVRRERKAAANRRMAEHLVALRERGFVTASNPAATAELLFSLLENYYRVAIIDGVPVGDETTAAATEVLERAIFGRL